MKTTQTMSQAVARNMVTGRKMGEIITLVITSRNQVVHTETFDNRKYYRGKGAKYNSSLKHPECKFTMNLTELRVRYNEIIQAEKARIQKAKALENLQKHYELECAKAKNEGVYYLTEKGYAQEVNLSAQEREKRTFNAERLARTLNISIEDAMLLHSQGKTYVFAKKLDGSGTIELFHPALGCNELSILITPASQQRITEFNEQAWKSAPYAGLVGQTSQPNHFVC